MKLKHIDINVFYDDADGERQMVSKREMLSFESAEEALGKLQRFIEKPV